MDVLPHVLFTLDEVLKDIGKSIESASWHGSIKATVVVVKHEPFLGEGVVELSPEGVGVAPNSTHGLEPWVGVEQSKEVAEDLSTYS